jgi:hypothetical protein
MDPTAAEMLELTTVQSLCEWAGVSEDLFARISTQIGSKPQQIRHIASIPQKNAMQDLTSQTDPPSQGPSPLEWGLIHSFRRAARSLFSLPPEEVHKTTTPDNEVPPAPPLHPDQKSTLKLSELVNAMWDHKLIPLSGGYLRHWFAGYLFARAGKISKNTTKSSKNPPKPLQNPLKQFEWILASNWSPKRVFANDRF